MDSSLDRETLRYFNQDLIAKSGIEIFYNLSFEENAFSKIFSAKEALEKAYPENHVLKNATKFFLTGVHKDNIKEQAKIKRQKIHRELSEANRNIATNAEKKIKHGSTVFMHSINNHLYEIAKKLKDVKIQILEHPQHAINKTFYEKFKGNTKMFPDLSLKDAVLNSDICLIGAEGINKYGAIVKKGSILVVEEANKNHIPVYVCASTHKHTNESEFNKDIFEHIENEKVSGIILEHGIFESRHGHEESRMFHFKS